MVKLPPSLFVVINLMSCPLSSMAVAHLVARRTTAGAYNTRTGAGKQLRLD